MTVTPQRNRIFGLTHHEDGSVRLRTPRSVKISIGMPSVGPDISPIVMPDGSWMMRVGQKQLEYKTMEECVDAYNKFAADPSTPQRRAPARLSYFTFRMSGSKHFTPAWDVIAAHGHMPKAIPVRVLNDEPFTASIEAWAAGRLKCWGDGINGMRSVDYPMGREADAAAAKAHNEKWFPIVNGCRERGCPIPNTKECKNHGKLRVMLDKCPILGAFAEFDTTGSRSVAYLHSSLYELQQRMAGMGLRSLEGVPLEMVLEPYKTTYKDKDGKEVISEQYSVRLQIQPHSLKNLARELAAAVNDFHVPLQLEAGEVPISDGEEEDLTAEFYPSAEEEGADEEVPARATGMAANTQAKVVSVSDRIAGKALF